MGKLVKPIPKILLMIGLMAVCGRAADSSVVELDEFAPNFAVDFGQIVKGKTGSDEFEYQPMNRNRVLLEQGGRFGEEWRFNVGFMGLMWWPFNTHPTEPIHRTMRVESRIREAKAWRNFGNAEGGTFLEMGYFPYKYNPDARNLGEYLYRSGTYPGIVYTTDGFQLMDNAVFDTYGAHFRHTHSGGLVTHDFNLFLEPLTAPIGDITPAYELSLKHPVFEMGVGAAFSRGIAWRPSRLQPKTPDNTFATVTDERTNADNTKDTVLIKGRLDGIAAINPLDTAIHGYWTKRGVKWMARAALNFGFLLPDNLRGAEDLRIFMEMAVLGWANQGFFYEKRSERMPIMAGVNLPTFTLLDLLSVQAEYYAARFDNTQSYTTSSLPVWDVESFSTYDPDDFKRDDWKWSLYAKKSFGRLFRVRAQIANDHLRLREFVLQQSDETITRNPSHWYYLMRLEFGI
jgi:hypothetical protein